MGFNSAFKGLKDNNRANVARNQFSSQSLCTTRTTPQYQMLVFYPAFNLSSYILPRDPKERLGSNKPLNRTVPCGLGDLISSQSGTPRDLIPPHSLSGTDVIQCLLALSYQTSNITPSGLSLYWC